MSRIVLSETQLHPAIRDRVAGHYREAVESVARAVAQHDVVVVGMTTNPYPKKARALLDSAGIAHCYLSFGGYTSQWRLRTALKMWSGWPTFPMVFVKGTLVGGYDDLRRLYESGQLAQYLSAPALPTAN